MLFSSKTHSDYKVKKLPFFRRIAMDSFDALPQGHNMMALVELDVTHARYLLNKQKRAGKEMSFFSFMVKCIAQTLSEYPSFNATRVGRKIVEYYDVDVNFPIELDTPQGKFPRQVSVRQASEKTVEEIYREIKAARDRHRATNVASIEDAMAIRFMKTLFLMPKWIREQVLKNVANNPSRIKKMTGTTFITSVGSSDTIKGYAIPYMAGSRAVSFAIGSIAERPAVIDQAIVAREFLHMTVIFNHDIVDGAPAARFVYRLQEIVENVDDII
jgi:pyruvate/2-oxoglutarate dehydrogenase complex dihydrolipoamide acyltransferase (E2) component